MQRYSVTATWEPETAYMVEDDEGEYVRWADVERIARHARRTCDSGIRAPTSSLRTYLSRARNVLQELWK